jgi:Chalcone isomerase-like
MKILLLAVLLLLLPHGAFALEVAGVPVEQTEVVNNQTLRLNGSGIRKKFFVKVYVGSLYAAKRLATSGEVLNDPGDKLIRMRFLHSKVGKEKIVEAFAEGFANNAPELVAAGEGKKFLAFFTDDFVKGDTVDLQLAADGTVTAKHNRKVLGSVKSARLAQGILTIYFGDKPADETLKKGMLGIH